MPMTTIKEITAMCKAGQIQEAYEIAKGDLQAMPTDVWVQRKVGWVLYYMIKADADRSDFHGLLGHLDELKSLDLLTVAGDGLLYNSVLFKLGIVVNHISPKDIESSAKLSALFQRLKGYQFSASEGYSFLLQGYLKFDTWTEAADFFDWWNLANLLPEDYTPFINEAGRKLMALAERAFISNAKVLLRLNDLGRIKEFLPKLNALMTAHSEMTYLGYFYGKLLLKLGSNKEEALKVVVPFARKKASEFWVWQLLSEVYVDEPDMQLACLLRAVHCKTQETFLGKVRIKLATLYVQRNQLDKARFHIDVVTRCYASNGWRLPYEIECWVHQSWINTVIPNGNDDIDYMGLTNSILCDGAEEAVAIVTYVDQNSHKASLIYGSEKRMFQKLRVKVEPGTVLKINYIMSEVGIRILNAEKAMSLPDLNYAKIVEGIVDKHDDKEFAFLKSGSLRCYVAPGVVKKYNVQNGEKVKSLIVYDYDKKKDSWNWVCINIKR